MSSSPPLGTEVILGIAGIGTTVVVVGLFLRATRFKKPVAQAPGEVKEPVAEEASLVESKAGERVVFDVEQAEKSLKLLVLEKDALVAVIAKFFEAEDDKDISKEDRLRVSSEYESKLKILDDRIKHTKLVVYLNKLEKMREEIVKRLDTEIKKTRGELKIEEPIEMTKKPAREKKPEETKEEEEGEDEEKPKQRRQRVSEIDEKIEKLRQEVLKELEELEKLEIEI